MPIHPLKNRGINKRSACGAFLCALVLPLALAHQTLRAATPAAPVSATVALANDAPALQSRLKATAEEWSILYPRLQRITALREEVHATIVPGAPVRNTKPMGIFDSPLGGTSLDAPPAMASRGNSRGGPFDPDNAPGSPAVARGRGVLGLIGGALGRVVIDMAMPAPGSSVQNLLNELQTNLNATETSDEEIREKLAAVRAARARAARDLAAAQSELTPFLTPDQLAILVVLDYLD
jgi:hypothetical protein